MDINSVPDVVFGSVIVGDSQYRVPIINEGSVESKLSSWRPNRKATTQIVSQVEEDEPMPGICGVENPFAGIFEIEEDGTTREDDGMIFAGGFWSFSQPLSHHHHKAVFGKRYVKLHSMERDYSCTISMKELDRILLSSKSKINIVRLLMYISERMKEAKLKYTHFVCLPLNTSAELATSLDSLASQITDVRLKESLVPARKLHFTLCMLNLSTQTDLDRVKHILQRVNGFFGSNRRVIVELGGVQSMSEDAGANLRVAYTGGVGGDGPGGWKESIGGLAETVVGQLSDEGFVDLKKTKGFFNGKLGKLHATILNSKYSERLHPGDGGSSSDSGGEFSRSKGERQEWAPPSASSPKSERRIDGAQFLQRFKEFRFGQVQVNQLRLCSLVEDHAKEKDVDGFYQTELVVHL